MATGRRARDLQELASNIERVTGSCIYYHFWEAHLRARLGEIEPANDFAIWARFSLHDMPLAERLGFINPTHYPDVEALRRRLLSVVNARVSERGERSTRRADEPFNFIRSRTVVTDIGIHLERPEELCDVLPKLSETSIFYHCVDALVRSPVGVDDFRAWLSEFGDAYSELGAKLGELDPYFTTLDELRSRLTSVFRHHFGKGPA